MKTKHLSDQLVDCAFTIAIYTVPGLIEADKTTREAYKSLTREVLFGKLQSKTERKLGEELNQEA